MPAEFTREDLYRILQVDPAAHPEIVRAAYRTLLRVLGKHPDHGGDPVEARNIIQAYATLSVPERRNAYDQWLRAHSLPRPAPTARTVARPASALPPELARRLCAAFDDYREAPDAPFARNFDLVLEGLSLTTPRVYVRAYATIGRTRWPLLLTLSRAVALSRGGLLPSTDLVVFAGRQVAELDELLAETRFNSAPFRWHRHLIAVATLEPPALHVSLPGPLPRVVKRLRAALSTTTDHIV